jgi:hypothetical protein
VTRLLPHVWLVRCRSNPNTHHEADRATRVIIAATERTAVRDGIETLSEIYRRQTMQRKPSWTVESTIGLVFIIVGSVSVAMVLAVIGLTAYAITTPTPEQTIIQKVETTGDVKRLCLEAKTGEHIDAMSCELIDPASGGVK